MAIGSSNRLDRCDDKGRRGSRVGRGGGKGGGKGGRREGRGKGVQER